MSDQPPHLSSEKAERNRQIAAARTRGVGWKVIAEAFGVSERHARHCEEEAQAAAPTLDLHEPEAALHEALDVLAWASTRLADLAEHGDNSSAKVGAISKRVDVALKRIEVLSRAGLVPPTAASWRWTVDTKAAVDAFYDLAEEVGIDMEELDRRLSAIPGLLPPPLNGAAP